jgi:hypothetical protein
MQVLVEIFFYSPDLGKKVWLHFIKSLPGRVLAETPNYTG